MRCFWQHFGQCKKHPPSSPQTSAAFFKAPYYRLFAKKAKCWTTLHTLFSIDFSLSLLFLSEESLRKSIQVPRCQVYAECFTMQIQCTLRALENRLFIYLYVHARTRNERVNRQSDILLGYFVTHCLKLEAQVSVTSKSLGSNSTFYFFLVSSLAACSFVSSALIANILNSTSAVLMVKASQHKARAFDEAGEQVRTSQPPPSLLHDSSKNAFKQV